MTNEEIIRLIKQDNEHKQELMMQLWEQNEGLVSKFVNKFIGIIDKNEAKQECYIAMCNAVDTFTDDMSYKFTTWLTALLPNHLRRYADKCCKMIRIPEGLAAEVGRYKKIINLFNTEEGREPTNIEIAGLLGVDIKRVLMLAKVSITNDIKSLDEPIKGIDNEDNTLESTIPCDVDEYESIEKQQDHEVMAADIEKAIEILPNQQKEIIKKRYFEEKTFKEVGEAVEMSGQNVRLNCKHAIRTLRNCRYTNNLKGYYDIYLAAASTHHVGVTRFKTTWTSEVEREILRKTCK